MNRHIFFALISVFVLLASHAEAQKYAIVGTGQRKCYDNSQPIPPPQAGEAFFGQDMQYPRLPARYTAGGDGKTVFDENTGLTWQRSPDTNGDGAITFADKLTWAQAQARPAALNAISFGGFSDWRLPTIKELYSLMNFNGMDPSGLNGTDTRGLNPFIDTLHFAFAYGDQSAGERIIDAQYVSSTVYVSKADKIFGLNLADGRIKGYDLQMPGGGQKTFCVQCVRGNPGYGKNDFTDNGDSTITDRATGLMWAKGDSRGKMNWQEALAWAQAKNAARYLGRGDWRLPDAKELQSIVDYTRSPDKTQSAAIDPSFLCTTITNEAGQSDYPNFWTSTTHGAFNGMGAAAIYISFGRGLGYMNGSWVDVHGAGCQRSDPKAGNPADFPYGRGPQGDAIRIYNYVRLVRTAQPATGLHGETGPAVRSFALGPSYPNPVSATARIRFAVPSRERVALRMYDMLGRMVRVLFEGEAGPGAQEIIFRPENLRNGVYLCELRCESGISRRNIILQR